jgi:capsular exopolysaccharide synthesis family protein
VPSIPNENQFAKQPTQEEQSEGLDVFGFLRRRKAFIILLGIVGVAVSYMIFQRKIPQYKSDAWVQVIHRNVDPRVQNLMAGNNLSDSDYVIKSPKTLEAAFTDYGLGKLATFQGNPQDVAIEKMTKMISSKSLSANVIQVSATGALPGDIREILQAVAEVYVTTIKGDYKDASEELKELLTKARFEFLEELKKAEKDYAAFRAESNLNTDGDNPYRARARAAQAKVSELQLEKTQRKAHMEQLVAAIDRGGAREAILLLVGRGSEIGTTQAVDHTVRSTANVSQTLYPLLQQEAKLSSELGADHPKLKLLRMQIEMTRRHIKEMAAASIEGSEVKDPAATTVDFIGTYIQSLQEELMIIDRQQADLSALAKKEETLAREMMNEEIEDANRKNEIARLSQLFNEMTMQISEIQVKSGMGGVTAHVLSPARQGYLVYPILSQFLAMGGFLGAFAGLALGYLVEMADRSFRKPEEIIREFGLPIVGHIPFFTERRMKEIPAETSMDKSAITFHLPRSRPAEAYRSVRTALCFGAYGGSHRVLQVTSPGVGDGKSTLALNLSLSMAQSGKKTVLVETDFRRPKVHKLTGVKNKVGLVDVLRGDAELADAIQETQLPDFDVIPCGSRPKDPAELLARPQFEQLLSVLKEKYDYVFIDSPPVLAVTDPCGVAARVDGVLICMRLNRHTRQLGQRAISQLRDVGATIAGIVINGVEEQDSYGYGTYRYSDYGSDYRTYNNSLKYIAYGSGESQDYYVEDTTERLVASSLDASPDTNT